MTVIPESVYLRTGLKRIQSSDKELYGPNQLKLLVKGKFKATLKTATSNETVQDTYIVENLKEPLLGRPAIDALDLIQKVETIESDVEIEK